MSVDLTLYVPLNKEPVSENLGVWLCDTKLVIERDTRLFDAIRGITYTKSIVPMMACDAYYDKDTDQNTYGDVTRCDTGEPLERVAAVVLAETMKDNVNHTHERTIAAIAYLSALPGEYPIILYWD